MLKFLSIRDFVIVSSLELEFQAGFTALTGETGAGKSILLDALSLALGERGDANMVRIGCERAEITAEFEIGAQPALQSWLNAQELEGDDGVCLMRRVLEAGGRSRGFINGRSATLQQMREAGELLLNIHGQHAHQSLLRPESQRELLDGYAGLQADAAQVATLYREWQGLLERRIALSENSQTAAAERELLLFQRAELEGLAFNLIDWQELQVEYQRLAHAAGLLETAAFGVECLSDADAACLAQINALLTRLHDGVLHDPSLADTVRMLESAQADLQEVVYALRHYQQRLDADPQQLEEKEQRIKAVMDMARKYRVLPERLDEVLQQTILHLAELGGEVDLAELAEQEKLAQNRYLLAAQQLSRARKVAAAKLTAEISAAMQKLAMQGGSFAVVLLPLAEGNAHGLDSIEFRVAANPGVPQRNIAKVASGGELSRISLAIQVATSQLASVPTLIFDEVDSGIGGRVAEIVGQLLGQLGHNYQVLCVTHLPQVAAEADWQWQVSKVIADGVTLSRIEVLDAERRIEEIARMLGGVTITETTRKHAAEMLGMAA
ncbi:MAG: DNA repair protein RecN [Gallionella sp.]|nr:DNA repair protein RecN [Gallionella sp.]MDD4946341.1 DNA repair protein RecN [Gallionella sp.]MDD5611908.1 DNA repair protein RecN [Gallionella sp.]